MFSELVRQAIQLICDQLSGDGVGGGGGGGGKEGKLILLIANDW